MSHFTPLLLVLLLVLCGCSDPSRSTTIGSATDDVTADASVDDETGSTPDASQPAPVGPREDAGPSSRDDGCSDAAKLVYLVDASGELMSFRPDTGAFTTIGMLDCPAMDGAPGLPIPIPGLEATPFSMSVDRSGVAWVLYSSGELFRVDTEDASCTPTSRTPGGQGLDTFGMGFASDAAGSQEETLFVAGAGGGSFGAFDFATMRVNVRGGVDGSPELTGTGAGDLWGFFPDTSPPRIDLLDKASGDALRTIDLGALMGMPTAWAFAFWGGDFWLFLQRDTDTSTVVYKVDQETGALTTSIPNTGKRIVGAGVSTCAPIEVL